MFNSLTKYFIDAVFGAKNEHIKSLENERDYLRQENLELRSRIDFILRIPNLSSIPVNTKKEDTNREGITPVGHQGIQGHRLRRNLEGDIANAGARTSKEQQEHWAKVMEDLRKEKEEKVKQNGVAQEISVDAI